MSLLSNSAWKTYRAARTAIQWSGLRKSATGRMCIAAANRMATSTLQSLLSTHSSPFLVHGHQMYLANSRSPSLGLTLRMILDRYDPPTTQLLERLLERGMVFVDVGAHVGYFALLAARLVGPSGRVYAFEPDPSNFTLLERNIALNSYRNVVPTRRAVSERSGRATLFLDARGSDRNSLFPETEKSSTVEIETVGLDEFFEVERLDQVDVLKIDAEGAEMAVMRGMRRAAEAGKIRKVIFEFTPLACESSGAGPVDFLRQINCLGFDLCQLGLTGETIPLSEGDFGSLVEIARSRGSCNLLASWSKTR